MLIKKMQSQNRKAARRAAHQLRAQRSVSQLKAKKFPTRLRNLATRCEIVPNREFLNWYIETIYGLLNNGLALPLQPPEKELDKVKEPPNKHRSRECEER